MTPKFFPSRRFETTLKELRKSFTVQTHLEYRSGHYSFSLPGAELSKKKRKEEGKMDRWVFRLVISLICVGLIAAPAKAEDTVAISVIAPLSGPYAAVGDEAI